MEPRSNGVLASRATRDDCGDSVETLFSDERLSRVDLVLCDHERYVPDAFASLKRCN
jgi:hypothetical protein